MNIVLTVVLTTDFRKNPLCDDIKIVRDVHSSRFMLQECGIEMTTVNETTDLTCQTSNDDHFRNFADHSYNSNAFKSKRFPLSRAHPLNHTELNKLEKVVVWFVETHSDLPLWAFTVSFSPNEFESCTSAVAKEKGLEF